MAARPANADKWNEQESCRMYTEGAIEKFDLCATVGLNGASALVAPADNRTVLASEGRLLISVYARGDSGLSRGVPWALIKAAEIKDPSLLEAKVGTRLYLGEDGKPTVTKPTAKNRAKRVVGKVIEGGIMLTPNEVN
jgi:hypothetical protein